MKRILHTISYAGVWRGQRRLSLAATIDKASQLGFDGVAIVGKRPHASVLDLGASERAAYRDQLARRGLECACIAGYTDFTAEDVQTGIPLREMQIAYVTELARLASDLGCGIVRVFTGFVREQIPFATQWQWCVDALGECALRAKPHGVKIAIQNHHDIAVTAADLVDLITEINMPNCIAAYDAWAPTLQGLDIESETLRIAPHVGYTTVADYQWRESFRYRPALVNYERSTPRTVAVGVGQGIVDYKTFLSALMRQGYDGPAAYEMCSELVGGGAEEHLDEHARGFLNYMQRLDPR